MPRQRVRSGSWAGGIVLTLVLAIVAFFLSPTMPLGKFWAPSAIMPSAVGIQVPMLIILNILEVITFGLGVSFLVFGWQYLQPISPASRRLTVASFVSIAWLLISWWPHDSLHAHIGENMGSFLAVEYGFHVTLMIAGVILGAFILTLLRRRDVVTERDDMLLREMPRRANQPYKEPHEMMEHDL
jgi:uncharacterized membrane protein YozB (DUF420 family)